MKYQTARQLMEAGFPQTGRGKRVAPSDKLVARQEDFAYVPTIDELLKSCGPGTITLCGNDDIGWIASYGDAPEAEAEGTTAQEALAHLWLVLNPIEYASETDKGKN